METTRHDMMYRPARRKSNATRKTSEQQRRTDKVETETANATPPFSKIKDAAASLGISQYYLRQLVRENMVPSVRSGQTYYIDMEATREVLHNMAETNMSSGTGG